MNRIGKVPNSTDILAVSVPESQLFITLLLSIWIRERALPGKCALIMFTVYEQTTLHNMVNYLSTHGLNYTLIMLEYI